MSTTPLAPTQLQRVPAFEALRGVMALWVLIGHVVIAFDNGFKNPLWDALIQNDRAVDIFIALSGFAILFLLDQQKVTYTTYLRRRFLRLFPLYIAALLVSALLADLSIAVITALPSASQRTLARIALLQASIDHTIPHLAAHLTMLHGLLPANLLPANDYAFLGQAWSISVEWQFYLIAPLLATLTRGPYLLLRVGLAVAIGMSLHKLRVQFGTSFIGWHVAWFALGIASFHLWKHQGQLPQRLRRHLTLAGFAAALGWMMLVPSFWQAAIWIAVFATALSGQVPSALTHPSLLWLGRISYSVYLTHMIVYYLVLALLEQAAPTLLGTWTLPLTLVLTLILSQITYQTIERRFMRTA